LCVVRIQTSCTRITVCCENDTYTLKINFMCVVKALRHKIKLVR